MSLDYGHHSPPPHHPHVHPAPNGHSSPRGCAARHALSRSPARSFDEQDGSALGYGADAPLTFDGRMQPPHTQAPLLPEKKRASGGEHSLGTASPAPSGFSSPHSGSSLSIPFPSVLPDLSAQTPGTASPLPGEIRPPPHAELVPSPVEHELTVSNIISVCQTYWL